jgi:hypothetical protein
MGSLGSNGPKHTCLTGVCELLGKKNGPVYWGHWYVCMALQKSVGKIKAGVKVSSGGSLDVCEELLRSSHFKRRI